MAAKLIHNPVVDEGVFDAWQNVAKGEAMAAIFMLDEASNSVKLDKELPSGSRWSELTESLPENFVCFAAINVAYKTLSGGKRSKLTFLSWVPDTLKRPTFKETIRIKTVSVATAGMLKAAVIERLGLTAEPVCRVEANLPEEASREECLARASKFERDEIDLDSVNQLIPL